MEKRLSVFFVSATLVALLSLMISLFVVDKLLHNNVHDLKSQVFEIQGMRMVGRYPKRISKIEDKSAFGKDELHQTSASLKEVYDLIEVLQKREETAARLISCNKKIEDEKRTVADNLARVTSLHDNIEAARNKAEDNAVRIAPFDEDINALQKQKRQNSALILMTRARITAPSEKKAQNSADLSSVLNTKITPLDDNVTANHNQIKYMDIVPNLNRNFSIWLTNTKGNRTDMKHECQNLDGDLAGEEIFGFGPEGNKYFDEIAGLLQDENHTWIGVNDKIDEGTYMWADGSEYKPNSTVEQYFEWQVGFPNDTLGTMDCAAIRWGNLTTTLMDFPCNATNRGICQRPHYMKIEL